MAAARTMKLTGSIVHAGREHHAGDPVPKGTEEFPVDVERLQRLGLVTTGKVEADPDADE